MSKFVIVATLVLSFGMIALVRAAEETKKEEKAPASQPATTQPGPIVNKKCPVGGEDVDPKGKTVVYKGKTVGFCCDECIEDFKKNPDKYAKELGIK